jgi:hypothetical protein
MSSTPTATTRLSLRLQDIAGSLEDAIYEITGERHPFMLFVETDAVVQFVSNGAQPAGGPLDTLLKRLDAGRADIPAHYNPDIPR